MARCPFAKWVPLSGACGSYVAGPYRIVHHTTEGSTAEGAMAAFRQHRSDPHFTVDQATIYQHIDTGEAARALRNLSGGVQTNRLSAIQIEVVGTAAKPKPRGTLENVARLCRWLENTHGISPEWPSGPPRPAINGKDPGGHNRSVQNWVRRGGHYGHCHVPENIHWDPAYSPDEARFVLTWDPDNPTALVDPEIEALREAFPENVEIEFEDIAIHDHDDVGETDVPEDPGVGPGGMTLSGPLPAAVLTAALSFAVGVVVGHSLPGRSLG